MMLVKWYKRKDGDVFIPTVGVPVVQNCGLLRLTVMDLPRVGDPHGVNHVSVCRRSRRSKVYVHDEKKMSDQYVLDQSFIELGLQQC